MKNRKQKLTLEQVSNKLKGLEKLATVQQPSGWVNAIRTAINMSLSQLGKRTGKTAQGIRALELREKSGTITLQSLREVAAALDMQFVYAIIPKEGTLEETVYNAAAAKAKQIVTRVSATMTLEDQKNSDGRIKKAYEAKRDELLNEMPKFLWD